MKFLSILLFWGVLLLSCNKDEDSNCYDATNPSCCNYDSCLLKSPVLADFAIEKRVYFGFDKDTFVDGGDKFKGVLRFRALEDDAQYEWIIGTETLNTQVVSRNFSLQDDGLVVPIKLSVNKTPDNNCFPMDDGEDTKIREITITNDITKFDIMGSYRGIFNHEGDSVSINLYYDVDDNYLYATSNSYDKNILRYDPSFGSITNTYIHLNGFSTEPNGHISFDKESDKLTINYKQNYGYSPVSTVNNKVYFVGRKLK